MLVGPLNQAGFVFVVTFESFKFPYRADIQFRKLAFAAIKLGEIRWNCVESFELGACQPLLSMRLLGLLFERVYCNFMSKSPPLAERTRQSKDSSRRLCFVRCPTRKVPEESRKMTNCL